MTKSELLKWVDGLRDDEGIFIEGPLGEGTFVNVSHCSIENIGSLKKPINALVLQYEIEDIE